MKQKIILMLLLIIAGCNFIKAQQINYQGIARNANGVAIAFQDISLRLTIKDVSGVTEYTETRKLRTNQFGLFVVLIGSTGATNTTGSMAAVNWIAGNKTLQVEIDPAGGSNFLQAGSSPLVHVPYAIFSNAAYPVGSAGGDLRGSTYPDPIIAPLAVTNSKITNPYINFNNLQVQLGKGQYFAIGTNGNDFNISSIDSTHTFNIPTSSATRRGLLNSLDYSNFTTAYNNRITSLTTTGTGAATLVANVLNIPTYVLPAATTTILGGVVSGSNITNTLGTISITGNNVISALGSQAANSFFAAPNGAAGSPSFRSIVVADIPTLNQNTTGSAATLTSPRNIYGNTFNGSADVTGTIASNFGGTGNGFTRFNGPATAEKTFTLPNANAVILTDNAAVTIAQGGTGATTKAAAFNALSPMTSNGDIIYGAAAGTGTRLAAGTNGQILTLAGGIPSWGTPASNNQWSILGNSGLTAATNFLGTTDAIALSFRVNNLWAGQIHPTITSTSFGFRAGQNTTVNGNSSFGTAALATNTTGADNTAIGSGALTNSTGTNNTAIGQNALTTNTSANNNTAVGQAALRLNSTADFNTAVGRAALENNTAAGNTAVGYLALQTNSSGTNNTAMGNLALQNNSTGSNNTAIGNGALQINTTGSNNTAIGNGATANTNGLSNATAIGNGATVTASDAIQLGNSSITLVNTFGAITTTRPVNANKFIGNSSTPSISHTSAIINNATVPTILGNDVAGYITFTTGLAPAGTGNFITITFNSPYSLNPPVVLLNPVINTGVSAIATSIYCLPSATTTASFIISTGTVLAANTQYQIAYHVIGR